MMEMLSVDALFRDLWERLRRGPDLIMLSTISIAMSNRACEGPFRRPVAGKMGVSFRYWPERGIGDIAW